MRREVLRTLACSRYITRVKPTLRSCVAALAAIRVSSQARPLQERSLRPKRAHALHGFEATTGNRQPWGRWEREYIVLVLARVQKNRYFSGARQRCEKVTAEGGRRARRRHRLESFEDIPVPRPPNRTGRRAILHCLQVQLVCEDVVRMYVQAEDSCDTNSQVTKASTVTYVTDACAHTHYASVKRPG